MKLFDYKLRTEDYLERNESSVFKGMLIILIMIGHNKYLAPEGGNLYTSLYSFHVNLFFLLPLFYNNFHKIDFKYIINTFIKFWTPYTLFFIVNILLTYLISKDRCPILNYPLSDIICGWLHPKALNAGTYSGLTFIWFMAIFWPVSICIDIVKGSSSKVCRVLTLVIILIGMYKILSAGYPDVFPSVSSLIFSILFGPYFIIMGLLAYFTIRYKIVHYISYVVFIAGFLYVLYHGQPMNTVMLPIFVSSAFVVFYDISKKISFNRILQILGENSLIIYLVHVYLLNVFYKILPESYLMGGALLIIVAVISLGISIIAKRYGIDKIIFPRSVIK